MKGFVWICSASTCPPETPSTSAPFLCSAPIKVTTTAAAFPLLLFTWLPSMFYIEGDRDIFNLLYFLFSILQYQYANYTSPRYKDTGKGFLKLQLINQRSDFSFALFSGGLSNVCYSLDSFITGILCEYYYVFLHFRNLRVIFCFILFLAFNFLIRGQNWPLGVGLGDFLRKFKKLFYELLIFAIYVIVPCFNLFISTFVVVVK